MSRNPPRLGPRDGVGVLLILIIIVALSSTACLRLTPSERSTDNPDSTSTAQDTNSNSSDTISGDTDPPCDRVSCVDRPHTRRCANGVLTVVSGDGYCVLDTSHAPACLFDTEQVECPSGSCDGTEHCEEAPCHGVRCDRPPPNACLSGTDAYQLLVYEREGRCQEGTDGDPSCLYDIETIIECTGDCGTDTVAGAHCLDEPCRGVVCNQPPASYCADDTALVVWNLFGRCADDGSCVFEKRTIDCATEGGGCKDGRCAGNPCAGKICYRPPARYCSSVSEVIDFRPVGTCDAAGACVYEEIRRDCPKSDCAGGNCGSKACFDPSLCLTPPAPYCNAKGKLVFWNVFTDCNSGRCTYATTEKACIQGPCKDGLCTGDPCEGPSWPCQYGAPAVYCANDAHSVHSIPRECDPSQPCEYDTVTDVCPGCLSGVCEGASR